jgi:hypothetical protein
MSNTRAAGVSSYPDDSAQEIQEVERCQTASFVCWD